MAKTKSTDERPRRMMQVAPYSFVNFESATKLGLRGQVVEPGEPWDADERHAQHRVDRYLSSY